MKKLKWMAALLALLLVGCGTPETVEIDGGTTDLSDPHAPKTVQSSEITSFFCTFELWEEGTFSLKAEKTENGVQGLCEDWTNGTKTEFAADDSFLTTLQSVVQTHDLAQYNGTFVEVAGISPEYGADLEIVYASGEKISAHDNLDVFLPEEVCREFLRLFRQQIEP